MEAKIHDLYPEFEATSGPLDDLRRTQYGYLDEQSHVYLDYGGAGLASRAQLDAHHRRLASGTFGNPHSCSPTSQLSSTMVDEARSKILAFFNASPDEYAVVFTANATGAARLVGEGYDFGRRSRLVLAMDNHNSINGLRQFARRRGADVVYVPMKADLTMDAAALASSLPVRRGGGGGASCLFRGSGRRSLFALPAQSNYTGVCHSLSWVDFAQERGYDVLLDAAAYVPTHRLDLSTTRPEFVTVSWYKVFGMPTGVGSLIVKKEALARLSRPWFSGGTVDVVTTGVLWHAMASGEAAFEDGTLNFLSIPDVSEGIDFIAGVGLDVVEKRVRCLTGWLLDRLQGLRHSDGSHMVRVYGPASARDRGGTVAFNLLDRDGEVIDAGLVGQESGAAGFSLRNGCFCNPGASEAALGITKSILGPLKRTSKGGNGKAHDMFSLPGMPTLGAVRVSLGIASTAGDIDAFVRFAGDNFRDRVHKARDPRLGPTVC